MTDITEFLRDAAAFAGVTTDDILAKALHIEDGAIAPLVDGMDDTTRALVVRLDRELRIRNPGLHYVTRKMFIGYRREGTTSTPVGERSQIFASIIRSPSRLDVVLPVDPDRFGSIPNAKDLRGKGHHGVGDLRVSLYSVSDIESLWV
ncbi:hypothetical protein EJO69_03900 [Flaviflexus salsibiostraticola]|uniref:Uncharacterized protein n=1 Tax=Flaviflexus salsibiostraticola TaxID=1282737 RepID=A0A3Q8WSW7_9ACTO|nr:hypothetical protein [Flaviflexus salsibiostraticola]AZN29547.1 hypothetical protein EJO69_03900 [Flaviflexus salsibiostraticola]